ncbi:MAG: PAS domain-containing protein, partial [Emcibacteraceae bacterium]|nr:PAS domain-containing protein [Emcibacteraceae bacterium]
MSNARDHMLPDNDTADQTSNVLNSLPEAILTINADMYITYANAAAEQLLGSSFRILRRKKINEIVATDSPLLSLITKSNSKGVVVSEYDVNIGNPTKGDYKVDIHVSPLVSDQGISENGSVIQFQERTIAQKINQQ